MSEKNCRENGLLKLSHSRKADKHTATCVSAHNRLRGEETVFTDRRACEKTKR